MTDRKPRHMVLRVRSRYAAKVKCVLDVEIAENAWNKRSRRRLAGRSKASVAG